ncbi:MAG: 4-alpha-glucanotransferase, partial [Eubacteriales bacterium]|nr:4-alpha-glucanotransferase [Eubacteriales bacterium]
MKRSSAILMAISSLPSPYGIGTLGKSAYEFVDFLRAAGQSYWQLLPLGPTSYGDSPYQSFSTFAGNPYLIDLDMLIEEGLLTEDEVKSIDWGGDPRCVDYGKIYSNRYNVLKLAKQRGWERDEAKIKAFADENSHWLMDYALFMAVKRYFGMKSWTEWNDEEIRLHKSEAVDKYSQLLNEDVTLFVYIQ